MYLSYYNKKELLPYKIIEVNDFEKRKVPIKKASIFFCTYNKQAVLPGTLYSITRQLSDVDYEICVADDCSDIDPESIIRKYVPDVKYYRYTEKQGFDVIYWNSMFSLISVDSEIVIIQSADTIWSSDTLLDMMSTYVNKGQPVLVNTYNANTLLNFINDDYEQLFNFYVNHFYDVLEEEKPVIRSNQERPMYPFLMAIMRTDLEKVLIGKPMCDVLFHLALVEQGFNPLFIDTPIAIHQPHSDTWIKCSQLETCEVDCKLKRHFEKEKDEI